MLMEKGIHTGGSNVVSYRIQCRNLLMCVTPHDQGCITYMNKQSYAVEHGAVAAQLVVTAGVYNVHLS